MAVEKAHATTEGAADVMVRRREEKGGGLVSKDKEELNYFGPFNGNIGYAVEDRGFVAGLVKNGVNVSAIPDRSIQNGEDGGEIRKALKSPEEINPEAVAVSHTYPRGTEIASFHGSRRYNYSVLETTKIPESWVNALNTLDGAITATKWGKKVYEKCGVENVSVAPHGVDTVKFSPFNLPIENLENDDRFKFLCVGKMEERKGYDVLLKAFGEEFGGGDEAALILSCHNPFIRDFNVYREMMRIEAPSYKNVEVLSPNLPGALMARLYASVDCFALPTRGEGWGLPITEAMASKLPVIATGWSGPTEYMTDKNSYKLDYELVDVPEGNSFWEKSEWAEPSVEHLRSLMREVFDNREEAEKRAKQGMKDMQEKFTWTKAAEKMAKACKVA